MSESSVSYRLRSLEDTLTVALFHRSSEGVEPTNAGREFFARSREALRILDLAMADAALNSRGMAGRLTVGLYTSISTGKLRAAVSEFLHAHPETELEFIEGSRSRMIEGLNARTIDLTVLIGPPDPVLGEALPLWREQAYAVVPAEHALAGVAEVGWSTIADEVLLFSHARCRSRRRNSAHCEARRPRSTPQPSAPHRQSRHAADAGGYGPRRGDDG